MSDTLEVTRLDSSVAGEGTLLSVHPEMSVSVSAQRPDPSPGCWSDCIPLLELLNSSQNAEDRIGPGLLA